MKRIAHVVCALVATLVPYWIVAQTPAESGALPARETILSGRDSAYVIRVAEEVVKKGLPSLLNSIAEK